MLSGVSSFSLQDTIDNNKKAIRDALSNFISNILAYNVNAI
ncbi:protein of unknown function [Tenacibaculum aestuariivivum]